MNLKEESYAVLWQRPDQKKRNIQKYHGLPRPKDAMYISCSIFLARSILRTVELSMNYGTHKIHMIMPLIVVNRLQVHTTRVLGLISLLYRFHQCIVICFIIQHDDYQSGRFSKVITHKCRRFYTKIQNT